MNLITRDMYQDAYNTIMELLKKSFIKKITFTKSGLIKVKFKFIQNKVTYKSFDDLLETIEKVEAVELLLEKIKKES